MKSLILGLLAETSIHPGAGQSSGFVDLPVAREAATDYPVIVGSSMKGALRDRARNEGWSDIDIKKVFGEQDAGGSLLVSDARLILLPIRSLKSQYKWVTCPHLIERLSRDRAREKCLAATPPACAPLGEHQYLGANVGELFLEERQFSRVTSNGELPDGLVRLISDLIADQPQYNATRDRIASQLVVVSDHDFVWFARYGLAVNARNKLHETKKTSENLWYEETIPPDSLFYCLLAERGAKALESVESLFKDRPYLQAGGNETVGQGWFAVALPIEPSKNGSAT